MELLVAVGANLGDRYETIRRALPLLAARIGPLTRLSHVYETAPMVLPGSSAAGVPSYLNAALAVESDLAPHRALEALLAIERELGRDRSAEHERWMSRVIDLDLLAAGDTCVRDTVLSLPHPEMQNRDFVLMPLVEIAPEWRHPVIGSTVREMLARLVRVPVRTAALTASVLGGDGCGLSPSL